LSFQRHDFIVDGTEFSERYLVNDACICSANKCLWSIFRFEGQATVFGAPEALATVASIRNRPAWLVLLRGRRRPGVLPGIVGSIQAMETISSSSAAATASLAGCCVRRAWHEFRELKLRKTGLPCLRKESDDHELIDYTNSAAFAGRRHPRQTCKSRNHPRNSSRVSIAATTCLFWSAEPMNIRFAI